MNNGSVQMILGEAVNSPGLFLWYTFLVFAGMLLLIGLAAYGVGYAQNQKTQMNGLLRVDIRLYAQGDYLDFGQYWIALRDPTEQTGHRLELRKWLRKAFPRRYGVITILEDYQRAYARAGLAKDPSGQLLIALLEDRAYHVFRDKLGDISRKKGVLTQTLYGRRLQKTTEDVLTITADMRNDAGKAVEAFAAKVDWNAEEVRVTLEYFDVEEVGA